MTRRAGVAGLTADELADDLEGRARRVDPALCGGDDMLFADRAIYAEAAARLRLQVDPGGLAVLPGVRCPLRGDICVDARCTRVPPETLTAAVCALFSEGRR